MPNTSSVFFSPICTVNPRTEITFDEAAMLLKRYGMKLKRAKGEGAEDSVYVFPKYQFGAASARVRCQDLATAVTKGTLMAIDFYHTKPELLPGSARRHIGEQIRLLGHVTLAASTWQLEPRSGPEGELTEGTETK